MNIGIYRIKNEPSTYAIVDETGKVIEKFRLKQTANQMLSHYQTLKSSKCSIIQLKESSKKRRKDKNGG